MIHFTLLFTKPFTNLYGKVQMSKQHKQTNILHFVVPIQQKTKVYPTRTNHYTAYWCTYLTKIQMPRQHEHINILHFLYPLKRLIQMFSKRVKYFVSLYLRNTENILKRTFNVNTRKMLPVSNDKELVQ